MRELPQKAVFSIYNSILDSYYYHINSSHEGQCTLKSPLENKQPQQPLFVWRKK